MKMLDVLGKYDKKRIYSIYSSVITESAAIESITLSQMIKAICKEYKNPENIISLCTTRELRVLEKVLNTDSKVLVDDGEYWINHEWEIATLMLKAIFELHRTDDDSLDCGIYDEIKDSVRKAIDIIDWDKKAFVDKANEFVIGYFKIYGEACAEDVIKMASKYLECSSFKLLCLFMDDKVFNYYLSGDIDHDLIKKNRAMRMYYIDYYAYIDKLKEARKARKLVGAAQIDPIYYKKMFYDEFDMDNPNIARYFELFGNTSLERINMKRALLTAALLNMDHQQLKEHYSSYFPSDDVEHSEIFAAFEKAVDELPSAALNGFSAKQIKQMKKKQEIDNKKGKANLIQKNARISTKDVILFQKVYYGLLDFTNKKYNVTDLWDKDKKDNCVINSISYKTLVDKFWKNHLEITTEFCKLNPYRYSKNEIKIAEDIKRAVYGKFVLSRYYDAYTAFVSDDATYMVKGLFDNIELIIDKEKLPIIVITAIIPFKNVLIYDGFLQQCSTETEVTANVKKSFVEFKKIYKL